MKISQTIFIITIILTIGLIISCNLNPAEDDQKLIIVNFTDPNFEELVREELDIPSRDITNQDMWSIKKLYGENRNISDLNGIEYCSGLSYLRMTENNIIDLTPIRDLVLIDYLGLSLNQIVDIKPLVDNVGIGLGNDNIVLDGNPLSDLSILTYKPQIQSRGVRITTDKELSTPSEINFLDNNFEQVIREHLNIPTGGILNTDLELLTNIYARNRNLSNIYGIEFCKNLDTLDVGDNHITDIVPLFYLRGITSLMLNNNNISDIQPIRYLYYLTKLNVSNNRIENVSYLKYFTGLRYLAINNVPAESFESIENLDSLKTLELMDLDQLDIRHIKGIHNLQALYLSNTRLINVEKIFRLSKLKILIMENCNLSDIDYLSSLSMLGKLYISNNYIADISPLSELYDIYELNLANNNITDILPLVNNWGISGANDYIVLYDNPLSDISINTYILQLENRGVNVYY